MKKNVSKYALLSLLGVGLLGGAGVAAAQGFGSNAAPADIAARQTQMFQSEATLLGISVDAVKAGWAEGQTFQQLATANGITADQLTQKLKDARTTQEKTRLQTLVDQGVITQAQADSRLAAMAKLTANAKSKGMGRGMHMGFGF